MVEGTFSFDGLIFLLPFHVTGIFSFLLSSNGQDHNIIKQCRSFMWALGIY
jgi:hypothetical protein